jgi:putative phosphoribosyl transferase
MVTESVSIAAGEVKLDGDLALPSPASGMILFAHGSGSGRQSPRNRYVAGVLQEAGLATLLLDLLTPEEEQEDIRGGGRLRFDIDLLANRLQSASSWLASQPATRELQLGYFGASTGAAAALMAAAEYPGQVRAIVSRGGRPDLAWPFLPQVQAPTLLLVGGEDTDVIRLNQAALEQLGGEKLLEIIPSATHLFEEPGTLEQVAELATGWLLRYLGAPAGTRPSGL